MKNPKPQKKSADRCERCGAPEAMQFGDHWVCEDCYGLRGSCCLEFGADDLWEEKEEGEKSDLRDAVRNLSMLWRRLDMPGHDSVRLLFEDSYWHLTGSAVFTYNHQPCQLDYLVTCNSNWKTLSGNIAGFVRKQKIQIDFTADSVHRWRLNGKECFDVAGCIDIDFEFSPSTNLIPIRRLNLAVGQSTKVHAAWLRFPSLTVEPLEQLYSRVDESIYRYEAGTFITHLEVNEEGFVTDYPDFWQAE